MDNKVIYQVGDTVIIRIPETDSKVIGKIEEIFLQGKEKIIRYNEFYLPEKTSAGRQPHNSKYELFKTEEIEKEFYSSIIDKCEVLKFDQYVKKIFHLKEKKSDVFPILDKVYFFRQKYNPQDDNFTPDLQTTCYCDQIFNPDEPFIQCRECKELIHVNCFLSGETKKCFNSSCNNNIENQLSQSHPKDQSSQLIIENAKGGKLVGIKRNRDEVLEHAFGSKSKKDEKLVSQVINPSDANFKKSVSTEDKPKVQNLDEEKTINIYPNLSEARRKYLINLIDNLEKKNSVNKPSLQDERSRKNIRDKICNQLLYGIEEIKEYNDFSKMKIPELSQPDIPESAAFRICNNLAVAIESAIYLQNNESINQNYKKKFQMLFPNLSDHRNYELRLGILNHEISTSELIKMTSEELAPSSLKKRRIERQEKYFKEQVLMKEEAIIITKTHKGEAILTVDKDTTDDDYFLTSRILEKKEESKTAVAKPSNQNEADNSDKASWNYESDEENKIDDLKLKRISRENSNNKNLSKTNRSITKTNGEGYTKKVNDGINKEMKNKNLSQDMINFFNLLNEYKREGLFIKLNDKLKSNLKAETYKEILKHREEHKFNK